MNDAVLERVTVDTGAAPRHCVIWLHGLGADGHDFEPAVPGLHLPDAPGVRFIFPHAPVRPVTVNGGARMRAWYDIAGLDIAARQDESGIRDAGRRIEALLEETRAEGFEPADTVLAGFSQGGAIALHAGLRHARPLAGIIALSCYLPLHETLGAEAAAANAETPVFMGHGVQDPVVPMALGERSRDFLVSMGYDVEWHQYPVPHGVTPEELRDIGEWLTARFR